MCCTLLYPYTNVEWQWPPTLKTCCRSCCRLKDEHREDRGMKTQASCKFSPRVMLVQHPVQAVHAGEHHGVQAVRAAAVVQVAQSAQEGVHDGGVLQASMLQLAMMILTGRCKKCRETESRGPGCHATTYRCTTAAPLA